MEWTQKQEPTEINIDPQDEHEKIVPISNPKDVCRNVQLKWNIP